MAAQLTCSIKAAGAAGKMFAWVLLPHMSIRIAPQTHPVLLWG